MRKVATIAGALAVAAVAAFIAGDVSAIDAAGRGVRWGWN